VLGEETVIITVGSHERKNFVVHKQLLCDTSEFFAKAFKGGFKEAEQGFIEMLGMSGIKSLFPNPEHLTWLTYDAFQTTTLMRLHGS
jgi:hypothetical protein